jgi:hypothetical protein
MMRLRHVVFSGIRKPSDEVLRRRVLGSEATYRVLRQTRSVVEVEVLAAPGLQRGTKLHLSLGSVDAMRRIALAGEARPGRASGAAAARPVLAGGQRPSPA